MARSARGDKCSLCGMDRACDLDATAPGLAAKWVTKGLTMDLYIYIYLSLSLYLGKNMVKELGFLHFFSKLIHCILKRSNIPVIVAAIP